MQARASWRTGISQDLRAHGFTALDRGPHVDACRGRPSNGPAPDQASRVRSDGRQEAGSGPPAVALLEVSRPPSGAGSLQTEGTEGGWLPGRWTTPPRR